MMEEELEFARNLIEKLRTNATLTGPERTFIVDLINSADDSDDSDSNEQHNKKVQVVMRNVKDSSCQTDKVKDSSTAMRTSKKSQNQQHMNESFDDRRIYIFLEKPSIANIKQLYPNLFSASEIKEELDRVFYPGKSQEFLDRISKYASIILECCKTKKLYDRIKVAIEEAKSEDDRKYALQVAAILLLPVLMSQNAGRKAVSFLSITAKNPDEECEPYIHVEMKDWKDIFLKKKHLYKIRVEGVTVGETDNFVEAVLVYFACFFIFDIVYPDKDLNTHFAMERLFLNAKETEDIGGYASEVIKRLSDNTQ